MSEAEFFSLCSLGNSVRFWCRLYAESKHKFTRESFYLADDFMQTTEYKIADDCKIIITKGWNAALNDHSIAIILMRPSIADLYVSLSCDEFNCVCELESSFKDLLKGQKPNELAENSEKESSWTCVLKKASKPKRIKKDKTAGKPERSA